MISLVKSMDWEYVAIFIPVECREKSADISNAS